MTNNIGRKAIIGTGFITVSNYLRFVVIFASGVVLARILNPDDFGRIGIVLAIIGIVEPIVGWGFEIQIIRERENIKSVIDTMFTLRLFSVAALMLIIIITASFFAIAHDKELAKFLIIIIVPTSFARLGSIAGTVIQKNMQFERLAISSFLAVLLSDITSVAFVLLGCGIWSLVAKSVVHDFVSGITLFWLCSIKIRIRLNKKIAKDFFPFAKAYFVTLVADKLFNRSGNLLVGTIRGETSLGFYQQALFFPATYNTLAMSAVSTILLPLFGNTSSDRKRLSRAYEIVTFAVSRSSIVFFLILGLLLPDVITFLYGSKWLPSVPLFRVMILYGVIVSLRNINQQLHYVVGDAKTVAIANLTELSFFIPSAIILAHLYGAMGVVICLDLAVLISISILLRNARKVVDFKLLSLFGSPACAGALTLFGFLLVRKWFVIDIVWLRIIIHSLMLLATFLLILFAIEGRKIMKVIKSVLITVRRKTGVND